MHKKYTVDSRIYTNDVIHQSILDYQEVSDIKFQNNVLTISGDTQGNIEEIFNEFMNYTISLINE